MPGTADQSGQNRCWLLPPSAWEASWDLQLLSTTRFLCKGEPKTARAQRESSIAPAPRLQHHCKSTSRFLQLQLHPERRDTGRTPRYASAAGTALLPPSATLNSQAPHKANTLIAKLQTLLIKCTF